MNKRKLVTDRRPGWQGPYGAVDMNEVKKRSEVECYMCKTDWEFELGNHSNFVEMYASVEDIKRDRSCWDECGVVKVRVSLVEEVIPENFGV